MKIISCNVNGIRAARKKGFFEWLRYQRADVVCLQEVRATEDQLTDDIFYPNKYFCSYNEAERKGYSGVAIYARTAPDALTTTIGLDTVDTEGRYLQADFGDLSVVSLYLPSGSHRDDRQTIKYEVMDHYYKLLEQQRQDGREYIICGDWNIAHKQIDIKNWRSNQKNSGFLPEERAWVDKVIDELGFVDAFRVLNQEPDQYTWWSNRGRARENNVGWRIDYQMISPGLADKVKKVSIYKDKFFSDHAPLIIEYDL